MFVVFGLLALSIPDLSELYAFFAVVGLILLLVGGVQAVAKKKTRTGVRQTSRRIQTGWNERSSIRKNCAVS